MSSSFSSASLHKWMQITWKMFHKFIFLLFLLLYSELGSYIHIPSTLVASSYLIRHPINEPCRCSPPLLQEAFCRSDFVMIGRYRNEHKNYTFDSEYGLERIFKVKVHASLKGEMRFGASYNIHYSEQRGCGWRSDSDYFLARSHYLIAGLQWQNRWLVTQCYWHERIQTLSNLQMISLFSNVYQHHCTHIHSLCDLRPVLREGNTVSKCHYNFNMAQCYSKYTLCTSACSFGYEPLGVSVKMNNSYSVTKGVQRQLTKAFRYYGPSETESYFQACKANLQRWNQLTLYD
jgi:hypothetical protein